MKSNKKVKAMLCDAVTNNFKSQCGSVMWESFQGVCVLVVDGAYDCESAFTPDLGVVSIDGNGHPIAVCKG